ncbi:MAG: LegC family aminotransferase [Balneola sp.]|nr:LegC family aminotransferase [Balneola sp.]
MFKETVAFIRKQFNAPEAFIPLHEPRFVGKEKEYVMDAIDSTFVSSVGAYVDKFENELALKTGAKYAVATSNGTSALHIALLMAGVKPNDEVITQPLTFVATANAITYANANCIFLDVDRDTMGLSPTKLRVFLESNAEVRDGEAYNKKTGAKLAACMPMHTFGFPCRIDEIVDICDEFNIPVVEDAAESLGSSYKGKHTGTFGKLGVYSFNGNKTITCGGGGAIVTDDKKLAKLAKHITTTAKVSHTWEYKHDMIGYNYRMPNLNAALACAQLEQLDAYVKNKRELALIYSEFFKEKSFDFAIEGPDSYANYWLMAVVLKDGEQRNDFLKFTNEQNVMTRPIWRLMHTLEMFKNCQVEDVTNAEWLEERVVNIPSSVRVEAL